MHQPIDRRRFVETSGLLLAGAAASLASGPAPAQTKDSKRRIRKAVGWEMIAEKLSIEDKFRLVKDCGFEGVEFTRGRPNGPDVKEMARASEKTGVPIHGVSGGYPNLEAAVDDAALCGANSVLCVLPNNANASYLEQYRQCQEAVRAAVPHAEKKKVPIMIENVWATFLVEPLTTARFVDELNSPFVKAYFDVGNAVRWGWPQHWIEVLGKRIGKLHFKEFNLNVAMKEGMIKAFDFPLGKGAIDWKRVNQQLKAIDYEGWATIEVRGGDRQRLTDLAAQMDYVIGLG